MLNQLGKADFSPENHLGTAATYDDAKELLEQHAGNLDVVFLDLKIGEAFLEAKVRDQGPGIPVEMHKDLFKMFGKSDRTVSRHSSTGLGLSIVKRNIELLDGTIRVNQGEPTGAVFTITIPLDQVSPT